MNPNPDKRIIQLGKDMDKLDKAALSKSLTLEDLKKLPDLLIRHAQHTRMVAKKSGHKELADLARTTRAFAAPDTEPKGWESDMADEYKDYLVDLAGVTNQQIQEQVNATLERCQKAGMTEKETAAELEKVLVGFNKGRIRTIIRTEGTRVANQTRQEIAERAQESGQGPTHMRWSAILDGRTTACCTFAHNHYRPLNEQDSRLALPAHYNCRSMETYVYDDSAAPSWTPWDEAEIEELERVRSQEFPGWVSGS